MITYRCTTCGETTSTTEIIYRCGKCSAAGSSDSFQKGNLLVMPRPGLKNKTTGSKMPIDPYSLFPYEINFRESFPAGNTPVVCPDRLAAMYGFSSLYCKIETSNPSGSFKDRASVLVAAQALYHGIGTVVLASTGNAGSSMSCAGAALGLEVILFVPAAAPREKIAQSLFYGAKVVPVKGTYDDAFGLSIEYTRKFGGINRNTAYNPMTIEGKKSVSIEIANYFNGDVPDLIYVPVGDGVIFTGVCKGFEDLYNLGLIERIPTCVAVQAEGSNAVSRSFSSGKHVILSSAVTAADSISVCSPACGEPALQYLAKTNGWCVEVSDDEILSAQAELARIAGIFVEPSSAAAFAGVLKDRKSCKISGGERITLLLTGSGFKDMNSIYRQIRIPEAVKPELSAVMNSPVLKGNDHVG